jgi:hypothetical protein
MYYILMETTVILQYSNKNTIENNLRTHLVNYYEKNEKGQLITYKPICCFHNNNYYSLNLNNIEIKADTKLACIIIFYDYLNENLLSKDNLNCYDDDFFYEVIIPIIGMPQNWDYSTFEDDVIFNRPDINILIDEFVREAFENDTIWFELKH